MIHTKRPLPPSSRSNRTIPVPAPLQFMVTVVILLVPMMVMVIVEAAPSSTFIPTTFIPHTSHLVRISTTTKTIHMHKKTTKHSILHESKSNQPSEPQPSSQSSQPSQSLEGIRLNKVFKATHSRREADKLLDTTGRITVNGIPLSAQHRGERVVPFRDVVALDGVVVHGWEEMNGLVRGSDCPHPNRQDLKEEKRGGMGMVTKERKRTVEAGGRRNDTFNRNRNPNPNRRRRVGMEGFQYVKYWKPLGVTCTTDSRIKGNIIESIRRNGYTPPHRVYPVGRLDKETSGLILLTSDGRLPNAVLRGDKKQPKVYHVRTDRSITERDIQRLRDGVIITTVAQRDGNRAKPLTQRTRPCQIQRISRNQNQNQNQNHIQITLTEGRNRQIRKMLGALDYTVVELQRVEFMGILLLEGRDEHGDDSAARSKLRKPGDWAWLDEGEMKLVEDALISAGVVALE